MRALLDVNVLIALLDAGHAHHGPAMRWLGRNIRDGWATCPLTENGCLRIMAQPGYPNPLPTALVARRLREATRAGDHAFWTGDISLLDDAVIDWDRVIGPRQLTDVYLLALAVARGGRFVTFDTRVPASVVRGAEERSLEVI